VAPPGGSSRKSSAPPAGAEWSRPREAPVEPPAPAEDRTVVYPRYDGDPAD
jgi:hypothetical protein